MAALLRACEKGAIPAMPLCVIAPREGTEAAANAGNVPVVVVEPGEAYGVRLLQALEGATVVCLAGFTRLLPEEVLERFPQRVLNIHPSLLPRHGGHGMYGRRVHEAVLASGDTESGCSVHYVTDQYDEGAVVMQGRCPVHPGDTPETLAARVLGLEHRIYPEAVRWIIGQQPSESSLAEEGAVG